MVRSYRGAGMAARQQLKQALPSTAAAVSVTSAAASQAAVICVQHLLVSSRVWRCCSLMTGQLYPGRQGATAHRLLPCASRQATSVVVPPR